MTPTTPSALTELADRCEKAVTEAREALIHVICPHIKQWCDERWPDAATVCEKCPATVQTSQGEGVQMCRLNAEKAIDNILSALRARAALQPSGDVK